MAEVEAVADGWMRLRTGSPASSDLDIPTIPGLVQTGFGPARVALGARGEARLLIPVAERAPVPQLPDLSELSISAQRLLGVGGSARFLDVICNSRELETAFAEVCEEILKRISDGQSGSEACETTVTEFRSLLSSDSLEAVDVSEVRGLVGELLTLEQLMLQNSSAIRLWLGPLGDRHDFRGGRNAVEVKSSARATSTITISSVEQLEAPSGGTLHLIRHVLEASTGTDLSVSTISERILARGVEPALLSERLREMGCEDASSARWNAHQFNHEQTTVFLVDDGFPRIVPDSFAQQGLPAGVSSLTYEIDLSGARHCEIDSEQWHQVQDGLLQCL